MSRLDGRAMRGSSPERVSGVELFQVLCQSLGPMQIRRGPPPTCSPLQSAGSKTAVVVTHPASNPPTSRPSIISQQSSVTTTHHTPPPAHLKSLVLALGLGA